MKKVFVSYSGHDESEVRSLVDDLRRAKFDTWLDDNLGGGEPWWTEILSQIRACNVFVFALSDNALRSKPCRAEREYAEALGLAILPVQIGSLASVLLDPIFTKQLVDYRETSRRSAIELISALHELAAEPVALPDPLPEPPAVPYEYLHRHGEAIRGSAELGPAVQMQVFLDLHGALNEEDNPVVLDDIRRLLKEFRRRKDVTYAIARQIDNALDDDVSAEDQPIAPQKRDLHGSEAEKEIVSEVADPTPTGTEESKAAPGWYADPAGRPGCRYFDGKAWTDHYDNRAHPPSPRQPQSHPPRVPNAVAKGSNPKAVKSLVFSLLGLFPFVVVGGIAGIVSGKMALGEIRRTGQGGRDLAIFGILIGVAGAIFWIMVIIAAASSGGV
jgi:hypothetical protein